MDLFKSSVSKVEEWVENALNKSQTYKEALKYVDVGVPWTVEGSLLRDAVKEKITQKALDSQIRLTSIQEAKSEEATEKESVLGKISVKVKTSNLGEVPKICIELTNTLEKVNVLIGELSSKKKY